LFKEAREARERVEEEDLERGRFWSKSEA